MRETQGSRELNHKTNLCLRIYSYMLTSLGFPRFIFSLSLFLFSLLFFGSSSHSPGHLDDGGGADGELPGPGGADGAGGVLGGAGGGGGRGRGGQDGRAVHVADHVHLRLVIVWKKNKGKTLCYYYWETGRGVLNS